MFLDFIVDIAEVGNQVTIRTSTETIEGAIVKLSKELIAIQKTDGSVIIKKDSDISHVEIHPTVTNEIGGKMQTNVSNSNVRSGITLIKNDKVESFTCHICGKSKTSKKYAIEVNNPNSRICNSCYGWTLSRLENK